MADNTTLNTMTGGDTIRDVAKTATGAKTQVMLLDVGGGLDTSPESIVSGSNPLPTLQLAGVGAMAAVPAGSTNGTALGSMPTNGTGARIYLGAADSVTFTIAATAPTSAPANTFTISGGAGGTGPNWDEYLAAGQMIYVTATTGAPKFRFL